MNTLLIGVGGIGEGVLAHIRFLESSSPANIAQGPCAKLLVSSTLPERHYALPIAGTDASLAAGSPEFSPLERALQRPIDEIRVGHGPQYLLRWLTPQLAQLLPERIAEVSIGTGQQAVLSRATVDLEAGRILNEIRRALRRAKAADGHTLVTVIWGAGSGGTGTGAGLEVLRLARLAADSMGNTTVIAIPVLGARGCEHLHERQREVESLYARTAGALFGVACAQSALHAVANPLGDGLVVESRQLADLTLVIEGNQGDATAVQREPLFGLAQTTAGIVASFVEEQGALLGALPTWRTQAAQVDPFACLGSAGAASIRIDNDRILRHAELEFARAFYESLLRREDGAPDEGAAAARELLGDFGPATMVRQLAAREVVAWSPPIDGMRTMAGLAAQLIDGDGETGIFPTSANHDVKWLADEVATTSALRLRHVSNAQVVKSAEGMIEAYLGDPATRPQRDDAWTVRGYIAVNAASVVRKFAKLLDAKIRSGNLDPASGLPYTVKQRPLWLLDTVAMLQELRAQISCFRSTAQETLTSATALGEERTSQLDGRRARLLASPRSSDLQRDYLRAAQDQLDMRVWHVLMDGWIDVADTWLGEIDRWLAIVGDGATGWLDHLRAQDDDIRLSADALLAGRRKLTAATNHRYMPGVGEAGERALLNHLVVDSGAVGALQEQCSFIWHTERGGSHLLLLEGIPRAPERERDVVVRRLTQSGHALAADYKLTTHVSADLVSYATAKLTDACHSLTIWDGMAYEFSEVILPVAEKEHRLADQTEWAGGLIDSMLQGAAPELALDGDAMDGVFIERFAWGPLTGSGSHRRSDEMARTAASHLERGTFTAIDTPDVSVLRAFTMMMRVPFDACRIYPTLLDSLRRIPADQLGLYAPEMAVRRTELLSRRLEERGLLKRPRALSPAAATLTADSDGSDTALRLAVLGTALEAFDMIPGSGTEEDHVGLIEDRRTLADFGAVGDWVGLIEALRARGNERAVAQLQARVDVSIAGNRRGRGALRQGLATRVVQAADELWAKTDACSRFESDVRLLFYAEALALADALATKATEARGA